MANRAALWALATIVLMVAVVQSARATGEAERYKGWQISSFEVTGLAKSVSSELSAGLVLSGESKLFHTERPRFYAALLEDDIDRARLFLARRGQPRSHVTPQFAPDLAKRSLGIILKIDPGPTVRVGSIVLDGLSPHEQEELSEDLLLEEGAAFSDRVVSNSVARLENVLRGRGYAGAAVSAQVSLREDDTADVRLTILKGERFVFGDLYVTGTEPALVPLVERVSEIRGGQQYSPTALSAAQTNLRLLDLFRQARLSTDERDDQIVDVRADLIELPRRSLEFGVGYLTDDQFWGRARWKHRNLFGRGRGFETEASASRFLWRVAATTWYPAIWSSRTRALLRVSSEEQREETYRELTHQIGLTVRTRMTLRSSWYARVAFSDVDLDVKTEDLDAFQEEGGLLTVFTVGLDRDASNDPLFPSRGSVTSVRARTAPFSMISRAQFASLEAMQSAYKSLIGGVVAAGRIGGGLAAPLGDSTDLLPRFRFYAGGASSMRGFGRRRLGPTDSTGDPVGGETFLEGALELRFPLIGRTFGALFVDAGQVWSDRKSLDLAEVEVAVGPAIMIRTPVGPIRGDVGFRVTDLNAEEPSWVFHLTIGQPF